MAGMREQLEALYELQQLDTAIAARTQALGGLDDGTGADAELKHARKKLAAMDKKKAEIAAAYKDRELKLRGTQDEHKKRSKQVYDGVISDPKQLRALQQKVEELGRQAAKLEEELLLLLETTEKAERAVAKQAQLITELEGKASTTHSRHDSDTDRIRAELAELTGQREGMVAQVSDALLKQYDHLRGKLDGLAVAAVREGACMGCQVGVPSMYATRLRDRSDVVKCESCRRILFLPEGASPFAPVEDI